MGPVTEDDQLAQLLADLVDAENVRVTLPSGSRDRAMVEQTVVVLNLRIRQLMGSGRVRRVTAAHVDPQKGQ
jgi:hypothetical protein